jgi:hypothetical protein
MLVASQSVVVHCFFLYFTVLRKEALNTGHVRAKMKHIYFLLQRS